MQGEKVSKQFDSEERSSRISMNGKVCQTRELSSSDVTIYFVVSNDYTIFFKDEKLDEFQITNDEPYHEFQHG